MTRLSVNVDHVATVREARGVPYPDPVEAAYLAEEAGAHGITVHLRRDRRHIQEADVRALATSVRGKLNLEIAASADMLDIAAATRPAQVTLVPERPQEVTTEGGLDLVGRADAVARAAETLREAGIDVSVFLDPDAAQIDRLRQLGPSGVTGFEINTDRYTRAGDDSAADRLTEVRRAAERGAALGFRVYAGHGLTLRNVRPVAALREVEELNIGHALVSRAILVGMPAAVREMLAAIEGV